MKRFGTALIVLLALCNTALAQFNGCPPGFCGPAVPAFVINQANPPDLAFNWVTNQAWNKSTGVSSTASSLIMAVRASTGYVNNSAGVWTSISNNLPRISNLGLLVEEARTNSIRNNSMQGVVSGSPGTLPTNWVGSISDGLTRQIVGTGIENGIDYIDIRFSGTTSGAAGTTIANYENTQIIAAVNGQTWAQSTFVTLIGGTLNNVTVTHRWSVRDAAGASLVSNNINITPVAGALGLNRFQNINVIANASAAFVMPSLLLAYSSGVVIDITLRIGWPQLELGAFVTSPIRTTTVAVARAADVITLTTPPTFGSAYSLYAKGTPQSPTSNATNQVIVQVDNAGDNNNRIRFQRNAGSYFAETSPGASVNPAGTWAQNTSANLAGAFAAGDQSAVANGGTSATNTNASSPTLITPTVWLGQRDTGVQSWNGFLEYSAIWASQRVPNAQLQSMTTP